jgi:hypothetical protein
LRRKCDGHHLAADKKVVTKSALAIFRPENSTHAIKCFTFIVKIRPNRACLTSNIRNLWAGKRFLGPKNGRNRLYIVFRAFAYFFLVLFSKNEFN